MSSAQRRALDRENSAPLLSPIKCTLIGVKGDRTSLQIINYHYRGACFKTSPGNFEALDKKSEIKFFIGNKELKEKVTFRIVWETIEENGLFGVEFTGNSPNLLKRECRFKSHPFNQPVVVAPDPLDPNRKIYFKVADLSKTGLLLQTSLTNKHIFPGMEIKPAQLSIPGMGEIEVNLYVENSRSGKDNLCAEYGVSIQNATREFVELASKYISNLTEAKDADDRLETLEKSNLLDKKLSQHLTIKLIQSDEEYKEVLKLRFEGYNKAGKVKSDATIEDMGEGLNKEGFVLAAYLSGQMVASCEFRLNKFHKLNLSKKVNLEAFDEIDTQNMSEINKLVVHPKAKGTDVVLGIFQKIHTIAIMNDTPDGVILSEPKLVSLYERLGFHKLNYQMEHPKKPGILLQLMLIKGKTYADSSGMNPYAWSMAFELSHQFFSNIGVQRKVVFSWKQKFVKNLTKTYLEYFNTKSKNKKTKANTHQKNERSLHRDVSDPRWTKQHVNATVMLPYILESEKLIGEEKTNEIMYKFGFEKAYFKKVSNWVSIDFFDSFLDDFSAHGDPYALNRAAGYRATTKEILGANYFIMKHFFSPRVAFKAFEKYLPKFNKTRVYKVIDSGISHSRIRISNLDKNLLPRNHSARENWIALLDAYVMVLTGRPAQIKVVKSSFDGDEFCEYVVRWKNPVVKNRYFGLGLLLLAAWGGLFFLLPSLDIAPNAEHLAIGLLSVCFTYSFLNWFRSNKKYGDILESMHELESSADVKYRELQSSKQILEKNYQESRLLDSINRQIQTTEDLNETLDIALENTCTKFGFKRAFIMILDDENKILRTASVFGAKDTVEDLWKFNVDISVKRENPALLSSVFHTGQSVIINDIENHLFHLNEKSQFLIKHLNVNSFSMVPIPSENRNWGVLIADKGHLEEDITRRDLVSLKRISQSIGLALDKKSKLDSEITRRKIFQKYVPAWVVNETLKDKEPKLGGKSKEAICLFLDIRNFTSMASVLPPEVLVEMLNDIFHTLQETVSEHGGVIDKFLGDGALVTWGVYPGSKMDPQACIKAVHAFNEKLKFLNQSLKPKGIPHIEVGVGIHKGPVIAGNIGSNERMEYTVIGSTVNIASRLEQLTKKFESQIVISEEVMDFSNLDENWGIHKKVTIRGISKPQDVACYKYKN